MDDTELGTICRASTIYPVLLRRDKNLVKTDMKTEHSPQIDTQENIQEGTQEYVVLLHGLGSSRLAMLPMAHWLRRAGYSPINSGYPSTRYGIPQLAESVLPAALAQVPPTATVHFVVHSLGGILVRYYLDNHTIENLGRVVMLGTPNQGSEVIDVFSTIPGAELFDQVSAGQLGTGEKSIPLALGPANFEVGIIAGTRTVNPILSTMLPQPNDGKVAVENTKLEGMTDHIVLPVSHTFMHRKPNVAKQVIHFLQEGLFMRE